MDSNNQNNSDIPAMDEIKKGTKKEGVVGPIIGSVIIIILIIIAGFYLIGSRTGKYNKLPDIDNENSGEPQTVEELSTQSEGTNIADIEADLDNTDTNNLDAEMSDIDAEFDSY